MAKLDREINDLYQEFSKRQDNNLQTLKNSLKEMGSSLHDDYSEFKQTVLDTRESFSMTLECFGIQLSERRCFVSELRQIHEVNFSFNLGLFTLTAIPGALI